MFINDRECTQVILMINVFITSFKGIPLNAVVKTVKY